MKNNKTKSSATQTSEMDTVGHIANIYGMEDLKALQSVALYCWLLDL